MHKLLHKIFHMFTVVLGVVVITVTAAFELATRRFVSEAHIRSVELRYVAIYGWVYDTWIHNGPGPNAGHVCPLIAKLDSQDFLRENNGNSHGSTGSSYMRSSRQL
jgi:hypothetical protein